MSEGVIGLGTLLKIGDGATPEAFTPIAEVKDITGPGLGVEFAEFTHQQSAGGYRENKPTFKNSGDVTFKCNFLPGDSTQGFETGGLLKDYEDGVLRNFRICFPDPGKTEASFAAYVASIQPTAPIAGPLELNVTLKVTGPVAWGRSEQP